MSVQAVGWALRDAPVGGDCTSRLILVILADYAKPDGRGAHPSVQTVSRVARVSERCVCQHLRRLREDGVIRRGDQGLVSHVRADRRPVVWDLCMRPVGESGMPVIQERAVSAAVSDGGVTCGLVCRLSSPLGVYSVTVPYTGAFMVSPRPASSPLPGPGVPAAASPQAVLRYPFPGDGHFLPGPR